MEEILRELKAMLPADKFIVTGSVALSMYGLHNKKASDIDIVLCNPHKEAIELANRLSVEFPTSKKVSNVALIASFTKSGYVIEVYSDKMPRESISINGIDYSKIMDIVAVKKRYGRMKDWIHLRSISRLFFKEEEFVAYLNK